MRNRLVHLTAELDALARDIIKIQNSRGSNRVSIEAVQERIERGFERRDDKHSRHRDAFDKFMTFKRHRIDHPFNCTGRPIAIRPFDYEWRIPNSGNLRMALEELDVYINEDEAEWRFLATDVDSNNGLDFEEFQAAVKLPTQVTGWASTLPLAELLADALPRKVNDKHPLECISNLDRDSINVVVQGFSEGLVKLLSFEVQKLKTAFERMDKKVNERRSKREEEAKNSANKFQNVNVRKMKCGTLADYHKGIEGRVGAPHLDFEPAMEKEHCVRAGYDVVFEADNYRIKTTPKEEWGYVVNGIRPPADKMKFNRVINKIEDLLKLDVARKSNLQRPEVIALVLYTGPMFHIYNSILRQYPVEIFEIFQKGDNLYSTTIFVLASAVQKISRVMRLPRGLQLYRGLGGSVEFPDSFFKNDENGCTGFAEWGFMSTTTIKDVAINYSGVKLDMPLPIILVISVGAADRGACIKDFSQYPYEEEYLWVPASFLEQGESRYMEVTKDGIVQMVPVKVNANVKTLTVEELINRKKNMHMSAFKYQITEVEAEMQNAVNDVRVVERLQRDDTRLGKPFLYTVENFVAKIVQQCGEVLKRHEKIDSKLYAKDEVFRSLVLEMVDVKNMAMSKLREWIENEASSFIAYRFNTPLRTAHRRRTAFLQRTLDTGHRDPGATALTWCKIKGLVREKVEETNELGETNLMIAAAEGKSGTEIRFLILAGADVNARRKDGVTAIWLAAQFGHTHCIESLIEHKADVNDAANDGATPAYIAAQSGYDTCIQTLANLRADVSRADTKGATPMHQAAMNRNIKCIQVLYELKAEIGVSNKQGKTPLDLAAGDECKQLLENFAGIQTAPKAQSIGSKRLIISSGDISDVDGFLAVAEYAKTGADVMFVMNYPAYIGVKDGEEDPHFEGTNPGLGFKYSATQVFSSCQVDPQHEEMYDKYTKFLDRYKDCTSDGMRMKAAMTDLAFFIARKVWEEAQGPPDQKKDLKKGSLYFCIGGVNAVNPFSKSAIKNEVYVYSATLSNEECTEMQRLSTEEGTTYKLSEGGKGVEHAMNYTTYSRVYMDFNGSMAFLNDKWQETLRQTLVPILKGVFVMGGVYSDAKPLTMSAIRGVLNRFSSATMNQLYHPKRSCDFFTIICQQQKDKEIPVFTITNNVVDDLATFADPDKKIKTMVGVDNFLKANGIDKPSLSKFAKAHYESRYNPPRKAFDFYTALAVHRFIGGGKAAEALTSSERQLFYCDDYGLTIVGVKSSKWKAALEDYFSRIDTEEAPTDNDFTRTRKANFAREFEKLQNVESPLSLRVFDVHFKLTPEVHHLEVVTAPPPKEATPPPAADMAAQGPDKEAFAHPAAAAAAAASPAAANPAAPA